MAKTSMIQKNIKRKKMIEKYKNIRNELKKKLKNKEISLSERFELQKKLSSLPVDSSKTRFRNRCLITGRPRGYIKKFGMSRIIFRQFASDGMIPGVVKYGY